MFPWCFEWYSSERKSSPKELNTPSGLIGIEGRIRLALMANARSQNRKCLVIVFLSDDSINHQRKMRVVKGNMIIPGSFDRKAAAPVKAAAIR